MISNYGIGGNEVKQDANEAITEIPQNRTLVAQKLTSNMPISPEPVYGLTSIEEVFEYFKPDLKMSFVDADGGTHVEDLKFRNLGDFGVRGITNQSEFLSNLETERDQYRKIMKQLKTNKILKAALADPEAKAALLETINELVGELGAQEKK